MVLRIEVVGGEVFYIDGSAMLFGKGRQVHRDLSGDVWQTYTVIFGGDYFGVGSDKLGIVPVSQIIRLTVQRAPDVVLNVEEKIDAAMSKPRKRK